VQSKKVTVMNPTGLHLRPAGVLCDTAVRFHSHVAFRYGEEWRGEANAKSVLSILGACVKSGDTIEIVTEGEDEVEALESVVRLFENGFGEA
jgi:phosphocarrier protein